MAAAATFFCLPAFVFAQLGTVKGIVLDESLDEPLPGVSVYLEGTRLGAATGGAGRFVIDGVPAGSYRLVARLLSYQTLRREIKVAAGATVEVTLRLREQPIEIPEIVVERVMLTGGRSGVLDVPGSAHYIGPRELETFSYNDIQRILRGVPGVNIQEEDGYGLRPNIGMRGTGTERSSKITVMEDGVLMAPAPYAAPAAYYFPTAGRMQGVEVRKGSSQIKYGPYTTGGAPNLSSTQIPTAFAGHAEVLLCAAADRTLHAYLGHAFENVGFLVETYQAKTDGFKDLEGGGLTGFDKKDFLVKLRLNTSPTARVYQAVTFKISQTDETSNETYLGLTDADFAETPTLRYAGSQQDVMNTEQRHYVARHVIRPTAFLDVTTTLYRTDFERDWFKLDRVRADEDGARARIADVLDDPASFAAEYAMLRGQTSPNDNALEVKHNNRVYYAQGLQSVVGIEFDGGGFEHEVEVGLRYHIDEIDRFQWVDLFRMDDGVMALTAAGTPGTESNRIEQATALAAHAQYRLAVGKLTATPGLRYESITFERQDYGKNDPQRTGVDLNERENTVNVLMPGVGLDYAFTDRFDAFVGVHKGFAPPGSKEGTRPEESINYEAGARYLAGTLNVQGVFFFNDYSNLLGADLAASGGEGTTDQFNGGAVNATGLEFSLGYDFGALTQANLSMPARLAYTFTKAEFQNAFESEFDPWGTVAEGDGLPYVPKHQLALSLGLQTMRFGVELSGKYVSRMRTTAGQGPFIDRESTDAHLVLDLAADYRLTRQVKLFASVRNLTNEAYIVARRPAGVRPGLPRLFLLGVKMDF
ncbi:MAG: TonB-dependent receptor [Bacteroidetes bacterium]|nr:TonB-dependent receptor [Bacteroidota bacterium]